MRFHCIFVLSVLATGFGSLAKTLSPRWDDMHIMHCWNSVPKNWESLGHPPSNTTIDLYIALKPQHENALTDALYQVARLVAPHPNTLELVNSWLEHHDISSSSISMTHGGSTLMLKGVSVAQANTLLNASYQLYRHVESSEVIVRTIGFALPAALHRHVLTVAPSTTFFSLPTRWQTTRNRSGGAATGLVESTSGEPATVLSSRLEFKYIKPSDLHWLYDTYSYKPAATHKNVLGIAGFLGDYPSPADLAAFMRKYRSDAVDATFIVKQVNGGGNDPSKPHEEANLDVQYAEAMAYPTPHIFYSTGGGPLNTDDWYISWLKYMLDQSSIPQTISSSYGIDEKFTSGGYAVYVCDLFKQLGARGVSVLFPSGDHGVGEDCVTKDGTVQFVPRFPATCPFVTAVGGTTDYEPEVAARISGGGFSNHFQRPDYQKDVVPTFLQHLGSLHQGFYNASSRAIPDIAAQALKFRIFFNGKEKEEGGTSASTPVVAGIISLLNDYQLSKGRNPLGFLNPLLYGSGKEALNDITSGSNPGCKTEGFSAIAGWDPVTGLGTPSFAALLEICDG
ncbi:subtilisin-like protein [Lactarius psammicola]|nr:subtilisin-like protein [Lactarius psammicola]